VTRTDRNQPVRPRFLPHDLVAEVCVLGDMMLSAVAIAEIREIVRPEDFYKPQHASICTAICSLDDRGEPADSVTVFDELRRLGLADGIARSDLLGIQANVPGTGAGRKHAQIVAELARKRRLAGAGHEIAEAALDPTRDAGSVLSEAESGSSSLPVRRSTIGDRGPSTPSSISLLPEQTPQNYVGVASPVCRPGTSISTSGFVGWSTASLLSSEPARRWVRPPSV